MDVYNSTYNNFSPFSQQVTFLGRADVPMFLSTRAHMFLRGNSIRPVQVNPSNPLSFLQPVKAPRRPAGARNGQN